MSAPAPGRDHGGQWVRDHDGRQGRDADRPTGGAHDWLRLAALLDEDPELQASIRLALEDPGAYRDLHADDLHVGSAGEQTTGEETAGEEGDITPTLDLWTVLLDGLDESSALAYLDVEDTGCELVDALVGVRRAVDCGACFEDVSDVDDLFSAIHRAEQLLGEHGLRLLQLEEDDDEAIPLVVVPQESVPDILALAGRLGHDVTVFA